VCGSQRGDDIRGELLLEPFDFVFDGHFFPSASRWRQNSDLNGFGSKTGEQEILSCCDHYYPLALPKTVIQFTVDRGFGTRKPTVHRHCEKR